MNPEKRMAHALGKLAIAERMVKEARRELREAMKARKPLPAARDSNWTQAAEGDGV